MVTAFRSNVQPYIYNVERSYLKAGYLFCSTGLFNIMYLFPIVCVCIFMWYFLRKGKLPHFSGPAQWPLLGNLLQIDNKRIHITFTEWAKQYGGVYKINLFGDEVR